MLDFAEAHGFVEFTAAFVFDFGAAGERLGSDSPGEFADETGGYTVTAGVGFDVDTFEIPDGSFVRSLHIVGSEFPFGESDGIFAREGQERQGFAFLPSPFSLRSGRRPGDSPPRCPPRSGIASVPRY